MTLNMVTNLLFFPTLVGTYDFTFHKYLIIDFLFLFSQCVAVPILPVAIPLIVDLVGGNDPGDDIVVRRGEDLSL